jgi:hypothetical protein
MEYLDIASEIMRIIIAEASSWEFLFNLFI